MASRSRGLMGCMSITRAEIRSASSASAARSDSATSNPVAISVTSVPSVSSTAFPMVNSWAGANEYRALELDRRFNQLHHRHFVGRTHHYEPRQRTGQADVLDAHLRRSILADRDPAVRPHRFQIDVGKRRGDAQLLEALVEHEGGKTRHERNFSRRGEAGADRNHVRLGDSALEKAIGKLLAELGRVGGLGEIRVEYDDVRVSAPQLDERLAEGLARGRAEFPFEFRLRDHYASSRKARAASSRVGAIP